MNESAEREAIAGAVARGWCHPKNSHKVMDPDLAFAIVDEVIAARAALAPVARDSEIQRLRGSNARKDIEMSLVEQLIDDPECELTAMDMEYYSTVHEKLKAKLTAGTPVAQTPAAYVPVHPRNGPLWSMTTDKPSAERLPNSYPLMSVYTAPVAQEPVAWFHTVVEPDGNTMSMYSRTPENPWSHWLEVHKGKCVVTAEPLYASPRPEAQAAQPKAQS